jgi:hypothetical protein
MQFRKLVLLLLLSYIPVAFSQSFKSLSYIDRTPVPNLKGPFAVRLPMKCSPDGTIYIMFARGGSEDAVTLIGEDGQIASTIGLSKSTEFTGSSFYDFAPADSGVLVLSGVANPHQPTTSTYYVSRFKTDGSYISSKKLDTGFRPDFEPRHIAAFSSGHLLLSGIAIGHDVPFAPFIAIFSENGQFLREVSLRDNVTGKDAKQNPSDASLSPGEQMRGLIEVSFLQAADDGNVYVMRHSPRGPVFVVSPGGSVRRVLLTPPVHGADLQWIMASGGWIAAQYRDVDNAQKKTHYLVTFDPATRTQDTVRFVFDYELNASGMACYRSGVYTFLASAPDGGLEVVRAVAR